jgi:hypothetical protein
MRWILLLVIVLSLCAQAQTMKEALQENIAFVLRSESEIDVTSLSDFLEKQQFSLLPVIPEGAALPENIQAVFPNLAPNQVLFPLSALSD